MRISEWLQSGCSLLLTFGAWLRPIPSRRRWIITFLAVIVIATISIADCFTARNSVLRDWLPVCLLLIPYWQAGQFFIGPDRKFQDWLIQTDRRLLKPFAAVSMSKAFSLVMEYAYLSCYPMVPAGLAILYLAGHRSATDTFWILVLLPTYLCYVITPFFPALPPRSLSLKQMIVPASNAGRAVNLEILKYGSIRAISFPSAHVASSFSVALVLLHFTPVAGAIFLGVAIAIAIAAVAGAYHYAVDVLLGVLPSIAVYAVWLMI